MLGFVMTTIILKVLDGIMGLRVSEEDEQAGLDLSQHSETAYALGGGRGVLMGGRRRSRRRCGRRRRSHARRTSPGLTGPPEASSV